MPSAPALDYDTSEADLAEPFGQAGVRKYIPRLLAWVGLTVGLACLAMGYRSNTFSDLAEWKVKHQVLSVASGNGQLLVGNAIYENKSFGDLGWSYRGSYGRRWMNRWPDGGSLWTQLGLEFHGGPPFRDADSGFWFRLRWPTLAAVFMIQPVGWVLYRGVQRSRRRRKVA